MSEIRQQAIEKGVELIATPSAQKAISAIPIIAGSASFMEYTQGWLAIASIAVGIVAGVLVAIYNWKRNKLISKEIEIKNYELARLKAEQDDGK